MAKIIDISQPLRPGIPVFPGDTEFHPFDVARLADGSSCNIGSVTMSLHTGTHADAPYHFDDRGATIDAVDLSVYVGKAVVIDCSGATSVEETHVQSITGSKVERILFKTMSADLDQFTSSFAYLSEAAAREVVRRGVRLVGVDTPSVDHATSKNLSTHRILLDGQVAILENLNLADVDPGEYELIALPLRLVGRDASPVRAVLRTLK